MALVTIWSWDGSGWLRKLVDPASLQPRTPENYWMLAVMARPPAPSLAPNFVPIAPLAPTARPIREVEVEERPPTNYEALLRRMKEDRKEREEDERKSREWAKRANDELQGSLINLAWRIEQRQRFSQFGLIDYALSLLSDHEYIEAMFSHYGRERLRLPL